MAPISLFVSSWGLHAKDKPDKPLGFPLAGFSTQLEAMISDLDQLFRCCQIAVVDLHELLFSGCFRGFLHLQSPWF